MTAPKLEPRVLPEEDLGRGRLSVRHARNMYIAFAAHVTHVGRLTLASYREIAHVGRIKANMKH